MVNSTGFCLEIVFLSQKLGIEVFIMWGNVIDPFVQLLA